MSKKQKRKRIPFRGHWGKTTINPMLPAKVIECAYGRAEISVQPMPGERYKVAFVSETKGIPGRECVAKQCNTLAEAQKEFEFVMNAYMQEMEKAFGQAGLTLTVEVIDAVLAPAPQEQAK